MEGIKVNKPKEECSGCLKLKETLGELSKRFEELGNRFDEMRVDFLEQMSGVQCNVISFMSEFVERLPITDEEEEQIKEQSKKEDEETEPGLEVREEALESVERTLERHNYKPVLQVGKTKQDLDG
jgi:hypothetical protein